MDAPLRNFETYNEETLMITDVPTYQELQETADEWLNLAWETVIDLLIQKRNHDEYIGYMQDSNTKVVELEKNLQIRLQTDGLDYKIPTRASDWNDETRNNNFWKPQYHKLNLAISLTQQAMELFLKAKIAKVSPYLLLLGGGNPWPKTNQSGKYSFIDFRTLDAHQLIRAVHVISNEASLPEKFKPFFEKLRKNRNKIIHLNAGSFPITAEKVLEDILQAFQYIYPDHKWQEYRLKFIQKNNPPDPAREGDYIFTHNNFLAEFQTTITILSPASCKKFLHFHKKKKHICCPKCRSKVADPNNEVFRYCHALKHKDGSVECLACSKKYTEKKYKKKMQDD